MEVSLAIDHATCIKCGKCVRVCPSAIFVQQAPGAEVGLENVSYCIVCGHCVAVCPTESVGHGEFPPAKVHAIDRSALPSPESVLLLCRSRRSNRAFTKAVVPDELIDLIVEAAHRAPTASNLQQVELTVITDQRRLRQVVDYTMSAFGKVIRLLKNPILKPLLRLLIPGTYKMLRRMEDMQQEYQSGDPILRGATGLLLIHTPSGNRFGRDDANLAYQNGSLMAESLGVSQFYTGFVCVAIRRDHKNKLAKMLGIEGTIHAGMAFGMPAFTYSKYIDRKAVKVNRL